MFEFVTVKQERVINASAKLTHAAAAARASVADVTDPPESEGMPGQVSMATDAQVRTHRHDAVEDAGHAARTGRRPRATRAFWRDSNRRASSSLLLKAVDSPPQSGAAPPAVWRVNREQ